MRARMVYLSAMTLVRNTEHTRLSAEDWELAALEMISEVGS